MEQVAALGQQQNTVLVIDDQATSRAILSRVIERTDDTVLVREFSSASSALEWASHGVADLVLVDVEMPGIDGIEFIRRLRAIETHSQGPIVTVSAHASLRNRLLALEAGATEFLCKPVDLRECGLRCRNLLNLRRHHMLVEHRSSLLSRMVEEATAEVEDRERETLMRLAKAGEFRDEETGNHVLRMARYSALIARAAGMNDEYVNLIDRAAPLHDIGKIGIPDGILLKPGKLDADDWGIMKQHASIGYEILRGSKSKFMCMGADIALGHHEKFDGSGYPNGFAGHDIPFASRIVAIADVYDALTSSRPYKQPWPAEKALEHIVQSAGTHFDPVLVCRFQSVLSEVLEVQSLYAD
jgi:two-component system response regulator RpfG